MKPSRTELIALAGMLFLVGCTGGCVERRLSITSEPSGALVSIGDRDMGRTPLETSFKFHGSYDVLVQHDGYEPLRTTADAVPPLYEYPGPDLVAELLPIKFRNTQRWHFVLEPRLEDQLTQAELEAGMVERATALRAQLDATQPPPPPRRPWLTGQAELAATAEEAAAQPEEPAEPAPVEAPAVQPSSPQPQTPPAAEPSAPIGQMTPVTG